MSEDNKILLQRFTELYTEKGARLYDFNKGSDGFTDVNKILANRVQSKAEFKQDELTAIEKHFHTLMRYRCRDSSIVTQWLNENTSTLPKITNNLANDPKVQWYAVGGMYGGYAYILFDRKGKPTLIAVRINVHQGRQVLLKGFTKPFYYFGAGPVSRFYLKCFTI